MCLPLKHLEQNRLEKGEHLGFQYEIVHNGHGYRCGYVRVLPGHPWFGKSYSCSNHYDEDRPEPHTCDSFDADVHGGITFADYGKACPTHGEADEWWVGFDCAHAFDQIDFSLPFDGGDEAKNRLRAIYTDGPRYDRETIKDTDYVRAECFELCEQAAAAK